MLPTILMLTAYTKAHFAMFKSLLAAGGGFLRVEHNAVLQKLTVFVDREKIPTHGKPALANLLLKLHIYRCTADVHACRAFYEDLTKPDDMFLEWRQIVIANRPARQIFVQANTFLEGSQVNVKEYEATIEGLIQSWAERMV